MNNEQTVSQKSNGQKKPYEGFSLKERLLPTILLAFAASLTVCFFGPFDIYGNNLSEFKFALTDFLGWSLLFSLIGIGLITAVLLPLRRRVFDTVYAVLLWFTVMLFAQGNYLNIGISSLTGDGVGDEDPGILPYVINTAIWVLIGVAIIVLMLRFFQTHRETVRTVIVVALIAVLGMQAVNLAVLSLTTDVWSAKDTDGVHSTDKKQILTYENLEKVSANKNIIYFVVDRFDVEYYEEYGLEECPELFDELDGFTYFDDMVSLYPRTFPAVPYMLTGIEHNFEDARLDYFTNAYQNSPFLKELKKNNYSVNIYTDDFYCYENAADMGEYISNASGTTSYRVENTHLLTKDMLRVSLFRYLPAVAKSLTGNIGTADFEQYITYDTEYPDYTTDMKDAYEFLRTHPLSVETGRNNFTFFHISGCHLPTPYDENFEDASPGDENDPTVAMKQSFKIINLYLKQLKELGLYKDATIIITGDHATIHSDREFRGPYTTALFVKESGSANTPLKVSHAPVMQYDIIPTILASEGISTTADFGKTVFEFSETEERVRRHLFQRLQKNPDGSIRYELREYRIVGNSRDLNNWSLVSEGTYTGSIYD